MLIAFAVVMVVGAVFAWAWIPEVQYPRNVAKGHEEGDPRAGVVDEEKEKSCEGYKIPSKTLETLAKGREGEDEGKRTGFRNRGSILWERIRRK
jgi:MFS transporter, PHS family, inorganic phosphate transporter